jgi:hypothetical protein
LFREADEARQGHDDVHHRRAQGVAIHRAHEAQLAAEFTYKDTPQFAEARAISKFAQDCF